MRRSRDDPARNSLPAARPAAQAKPQPDAALRHRRRPRAGPSGHDGHPCVPHLRVQCPAHPHLGGARVFRTRLGPVRRPRRSRAGTVHRQTAAAPGPAAVGGPPGNRAPGPGGRRRRAVPWRARSEHRHHPGPLRRAVPVRAAVPRAGRQTPAGTGRRLGAGEPGARLPAAALAPHRRAAPAAGPQPQVGGSVHARRAARRSLPDRLLPRPAVDCLPADRPCDRPAGPHDRRRSRRCCWRGEPWWRSWPSGSAW